MSRRSAARAFPAILLLTLGAGTARAACPPGFPNPIVSGDPAQGPLVVLTGLGPAPTGSFFLLGAGDAANSGTLPVSAWLHPAGDFDGDIRPEWYVHAPAEGPGGWGDPATVGCPSFVVPDHPPIVLIVQHAAEDLDGDGRFDVFEDFNRNGMLDLGEDRDGDGRLTPRNGCEGVSREDIDCDGRPDTINEDTNGNGVRDPGEIDIDFDGYLDLGNEDRNNNNSLDDRPVLFPDDPVRDENGDINPWYPYGERLPSPGGSIALAISWNGTAYSLQSVADPGTVLGPEEDLDHDGRYDVFEDRNRNTLLDPGEDRDGDGRLTPRDGCEGSGREDLDCDGRLDRIDEDFNHNGVLDPGEDVDADGHLDPGTEDRNNNNALDDQPVPSFRDVVGYPYGHFPPGPVRMVATGPAGGLNQVTGAHSDPGGALRLRLDVDGIKVISDPAVSGPVFDGLGIALNRHMPGFPIAPPLFVESGLRLHEIPANSTLAGGAFVSIALPGARTLHPILQLDGAGRSTGSDAFLAGPGGIQSMVAPDLLDQDHDGWPLPIDPCPGLTDFAARDADLDGLGDLCDAGHPPGSTISDRWVAVDPAGGPGFRSGAAMAYDAARGVTVLFGGADDAATWEFDGSVWRAYMVSPAPAPRRDHGMVWDADRRRVVLFGGETLPDLEPQADQWEYDAARHLWSRRTLLVSPGPRAGFGLARDERLRALVLFGGRDGARLLGDTWLFRTGIWRRIPGPQSPAPRDGAMLAYDARRERTVLIGGRASAPLANLLDDVWEFDGATWQPVDARGDLPPTGGGTLAYDATRRALLLFGGDALRLTMGSAGMMPIAGPMAATRRFDGVRFDPLPTLDTTGARSGHAAAFDTRRGELVVHGGAAPGSPVLGTALLRRGGDADGDAVPDANDGCPDLADHLQEDADGDGAGDLCDNCPAIANADQRDLDRDLAGDACDDDRDGDGVPNPTDICPDAYVAGRPLDAIGAGGGDDRDLDGRPDDCDRCPGDPADDADRDGYCAGEDNCPLAANPAQKDSDGNGMGDACQPVVQILAIGPISFPRNALGARVQVRDPDGDRLAGRIEMSQAVVLPEILSPGHDPCAAAWSPDGAAGSGLIYAVVPGSAPVITDVDPVFGCFDGIPDFDFIDGTCASGVGVIGSDAITIDHPAPFPICVRRLDGSGTTFDLVVRQAGPEAAILGGAAAPIVNLPWRDRLPLGILLTTLPAPGPFLLRITAGDGTTPEVADERLFTWNGERMLYFNLPTWLTGGS